MSSTSNHHYTTLPFTNVIGEPVLCALIITGDQNIVLGIMGVSVVELDPFSSLSDYASNKIFYDYLIIQIWHKNMFIGVPTYTFNINLYHLTSYVHPFEVL